MKYTFLLILFLSTNCFAQEDELVIAEYSSNVITLNFLDSQFGLTKKKEIDVSKFDGWLSPSKYSSSYSHFPIQFSANGDRLLISLINVDEMEDISYWTKFLSYNLETDELEELIRLDGTSISFWHLMNDNQIVGVSGRVLVKVNLTEAKYDTLFDYNYYAQPTELLVSKSSIEFIVEARQNLSSLSYNLESNEVEEIFLASTTSFSSIYNENLLTIEGQGTNTLKLRKAGLYALVTNEKKMKLNKFNSFWDSENNISLVEVLKAHLDDSLVPFYDIKMENGREKQTDDGHLSHQSASLVSKNALLGIVTTLLSNLDEHQLRAVENFVKDMKGIQS
jgi:hypothetical protein